MATTTSKPSQVGNNYYRTSVTTNTDGSLKAETFRTTATGGNPVLVTTNTVSSDGKTTNRTFAAGATSAERSAFQNPNSLERKAYAQQVNDARPFGTNPKPEDQQKLNKVGGGSGNIVKPGDPNTVGAGSTAANPADQQAVAKEAGTSAEGTREKYDDLRYPENLKSELQDVIKFSILKYVPSLSPGASGSPSGGRLTQTKDRIVFLEGTSPTVKGSTKLATITLPVPSQINAGYSVSWQEEPLSMLQAEAAEAAQGFFNGGVEGASKEIGETADQLKQSGSDLSSAVKGIFLNKAVQADITSRALGATLNNNIELLFTGPGLREFTFNFRFYPRSAREAVIVRKIIRAFKQAMSVKRSESGLLLKAPHTFAIQYLTANKAHPYLNAFKECALKSCSVNYTPDGSYMTYGGNEPSMTAYEMSLTFAELEPIFDDDYAKLDSNNDTQIGF